jgi:hypothetical protein
MNVAEHTVTIYTNLDTPVVVTGVVHEYRGGQVLEFWGSPVHLDESEDTVQDLEMRYECGRKLPQKQYDKYLQQATNKLLEYHFQ